MAMHALGIVNGTLAWLDNGGAGAKRYKKVVKSGEDAKRAAQEVFVNQLKLRMTELAACVPALPDELMDAVRKVAAEVEKNDVADISRFIQQVDISKWLGRFALSFPEALDPYLTPTRAKLAALQPLLGGAKDLVVAGFDHQRRVVVLPAMLSVHSSMEPSIKEAAISFIHPGADYADLIETFIDGVVEQLEGLERGKYSLLPPLWGDWLKSESDAIQATLTDSKRVSLSEMPAEPAPNPAVRRLAQKIKAHVKMAQEQLSGLIERLDAADPPCEDDPRDRSRYEAAKLRDAFKRLDMDGDGTLSRSEFGVVLGNALSEKEKDERFEEVAHGDGSVSLEEYIDAITSQMLPVELNRTMV
jgi:hypothetical protein